MLLSENRIPMCLSAIAGNTINSVKKIPPFGVLNMSVIDRSTVAKIVNRSGIHVHSCSILVKGHLKSSLHVHR
jgi:hypothetical protein